MSASSVRHVKTDMSTRERLNAAYLGICAYDVKLQTASHPVREGNNQLQRSHSNARDHQTAACCTPERAMCGRLSAAGGFPGLPWRGVFPGM